MFGIVWYVLVVVVVYCCLVLEFEGDWIKVKWMEFIIYFLFIMMNVMFLSKYIWYNDVWIFKMKVVVVLKFEV